MIGIRMRIIGTMQYGNETLSVVYIGSRYLGYRCLGRIAINGFLAPLWFYTCARCNRLHPIINGAVNYILEIFFLKGGYKSE